VIAIVRGIDIVYGRGALSAVWCPVVAPFSLVLCEDIMVVMRHWFKNADKIITSILSYLHRPVMAQCPSI
jgi:hypothetical protein